MTITLTDEHIAIIQLIEKITRAKVRDVVPDEETKLVIIVEKGELAKALGKQAKNLKLLEQKLKKKVRIIEFNEDAVIFLRNLCKPNKVTDIIVEEKTYRIVPENFKSRGYLIGRNASTLRLHESIMRRYFSVDEIKVDAIEEK